MDAVADQIASELHNNIRRQLNQRKQVSDMLFDQYSDYGLMIRQFIDLLCGSATSTNVGAFEVNESIMKVNPSNADVSLTISIFNHATASHFHTFSFGFDSEKVKYKQYSIAPQIELQSLMQHLSRDFLSAIKFELIERSVGD